jgi:hypothetical protein
VTDERKDRRVRVIDNGTEATMLARSIPEALYRDETAPHHRLERGAAWRRGRARRSGKRHDLCSAQQVSPYVAEHRELIHKIGVTGQSVAIVANARNGPTFLLADVRVSPNTSSST